MKVYYRDVDYIFGLWLQNISTRRLDAGSFYLLLMQWDKPLHHFAVLTKCLYYLRDDAEVHTHNPAVCSFLL